MDFGYLEPRLSLAQPLPADLKLFMHSLACSKKWESSVDYCSASAIKRNVTATAMAKQFEFVFILVTLASVNATSNRKSSGTRGFF